MLGPQHIRMQFRGGSMGSTTITEIITFIFSLLSQSAEFFS